MIGIQTGELDLLVQRKFKFFGFDLFLEGFPGVFSSLQLLLLSLLSLFSSCLQSVMQTAIERSEAWGFGGLPP
jgi:hypothetical protein